MYFTRIGDFTWRASNCEELVLVLTGDDGDGFRVYSWNATPLRDSVPEVILSQFSPLSVDLTMVPS